jgi:hypothetical protein
MATRPKFAEMANYSCECVECESQFGECRRMYRVSNVSSVECIESGESGWRMSGECIESGESVWRMSGECIESDQNRLAIVGASKIGRFMHK